MAKFDRYVLSQLLLFFGFFALVLVAVFWINRAVRLFDRLIADGQSLLVFLELTALGMPGLVMLVLPLAAFAATAYVMNRLFAESELIVMQATGSSPWRLARPVLVFGVFVGAMMAILAHLLVPASMDQLTQREREISQDASARLLTEGTFLHPSKGVTLYTREIAEDGVLRDVFLSDRRNPESRVIYTAATAYLVRQNSQTSLIMVDGLAQRLNTQDSRLAIGTFRDFSYDISSLVRAEDASVKQVRSMPTAELLENWETIAAVDARGPGRLAEEYHSRFAQPMFGIVAALIGYVALISAGFSRFGAWKEILIAFVVLLLLDGLRAISTDPVRDQAALWPLVYAPPTLGAGLVTGLLFWITRPVRIRAGAAA